MTSLDLIPGWMIGAFVGLIGGYEIDADPGCVHLVQMWTAPEARRQGVGRRLVEAVL